MKNVTLSAAEDLIERARLIARSRRKTLNAVFREWLSQFTANSGDAQSSDALMKRIHHVECWPEKPRRDRLICIRQK
jgi:hypothetical protein